MTELAPILQKAAYYFGAIGMASIWTCVAAAALALIALCTPPRWRSAGLWLALLVGAVAFVLARVNSEFVQAIEIDRKIVEQRTREKMLEIQEQQRAELGSQAADIRFAEDSGSDRLDLMGVETPKNKYEEALLKAEISDYAYRREGKKARRSDRPDSGEELSLGELVRGEVAEEEAVEAAATAHIRKLPPEEVDEANAYDDANRLAAKLVLLVILGLVLIDYLRRFNDPYGGVYPLPLASRLLDSVSPKKLVLALRQATIDDLRDLLDSVVRKGEGAIVFGKAEIGNADAYARWPAGPKTVERHLAGERPLDFLFEEAWFGRAVGLVPDDERAPARLTRLLGLLERRRDVRAQAHRTLNLILALPRLPADAELAELLDCCRETNCRLWLVPDDQRETERAMAVADRGLPASRCRHGLLRRSFHRLATGIGRALVRPVCVAVLHAGNRFSYYTRLTADAFNADPEYAAALVGATLPAAPGARQAEAPPPATPPPAPPPAEPKPEQTPEPKPAKAVAPTPPPGSAPATAETPPPQLPPPPPPPTPEAPPAVTAPAFEVRCPACGQRLAAEPEWAGLEVDCPACGAEVVIPEPATAESPPPEPPPAATVEPTFHFPCPKCGQQLSADRDWAGLEIDCPACGTEVTIPEPS